MNLFTPNLELIRESTLQTQVFEYILIAKTEVDQMIYLVEGQAEIIQIGNTLTVNLFIVTSENLPSSSLELEHVVQLGQLDVSNGHFTINARVIHRSANGSLADKGGNNVSTSDANEATKPIESQIL